VLFLWFLLLLLCWRNEPLLIGRFFGYYNASGLELLLLNHNVD